MTTGVLIIGLWFAEKGCPRCKKFGFYIHGEPNNCVLLCSKCFYTAEIKESDNGGNEKNFRLIQSLSNKSSDVSSDGDAYNDVDEKSIDDNFNFSIDID